MMGSVNITDLIGKTFEKVKRAGDELHFVLPDGSGYRFFHYQDCCESVSIEDICGELEWLESSPILRASEDTNSKDNPEGIKKDYQESFTWTFYNFATAKGHVTVRWYGESNGYYSESVCLAFDKKL
jgi:hypothetical protein